MESILLNNINKYYSSVDKNIINKLCQNEGLNNLINLSTKTDIYIFNKKNNKWQLKSKNKILQECEQIKKKEIKTSSSLLSNLAKLNNIIDLDNVKNIYKNLENKIDNIDKFVTCLEKVPLDDFDSLKIQKSKNILQHNNSKYTILDLGSETKRLMNISLKKQKKTFQNNISKYTTNLIPNIEFFDQRSKNNNYQNNKTFLTTETEIISDPIDFIAYYSNC